MMYKKHDVERMKELKESGMSQVEIARVLGISSQIVSYHLKGDISKNGICSCMYCHSKHTKLHQEKYYLRGTQYYVACGLCHSRGPNRDTREEAIRIWNLYSRNMYDE